MLRGMRQFLFFFFLPLLSNAAQSPPLYDDTNIPSKQQIYNNLMNDAIICANGRHKNGSFTFEKCTRYWKTGYFPFCVYMVIPSTSEKQGYDVYGCVYSKRLPAECAEREEFYSPYETVFIRGKKHKGAMMCCMDNYCNQVEEPVFSMVRLKDDNVAAISSSWPWMVCVVTLVSCLIPVIHAILQSKEDSSMRRTERPAFLLDDIGIQKEFQKIPEVLEQPMKFADLTKVQKAVRGILQPGKYSTASMTNKEQKQQEEEEEFKALVKKDEVYVFQKDNDQPRKLNRQIQSRYIHLAQRMIEHGPFSFDFDPVELGDLFDSVTQILAGESTLLELQPEIDVYGNLEGSYGDLFRWMHKNGWPPRRKVLFLGGLSNDYEAYSLETVALIFAMKKLMPNHVYILRGASEVYPFKIAGRRFTNHITSCLVKVIDCAFAQLPLAATVNGVFFSHGGVSPAIKKMRQIHEIKRPITEVEKGTLAGDLIFSQASTHVGVIAGSRGWQFTKDYEPNLHLSDKGNHEIQLMVRSRNSCPDGIMYVNEKILTIWSAPGYPVENKGGCSLSFNHNMEMKISKMGVYGTFDRDAIELFEKKRQTNAEKKERGMKKIRNPAQKRLSEQKENGKESKKSESSGKEKASQKRSDGKSKASIKSQREDEGKK